MTTDALLFDTADNAEAEAELFANDNIGSDIGHRVIARLRARGLTVEWASYHASMHPADSRWGRRQDAMIDVQGIFDDGEDVVVRCFSNALGNRLQVGAYDSANRFTTTSRAALEARKRLGM